MENIAGETKGKKLKWLLFQLRFEKRTFTEIAVFLFFLMSRSLSARVSARVIIKRWLKKNQNGEKYFDFNGAKLPDITKNYKDISILTNVFNDTFRVPCLYNDDYDKSTIETIEQFGKYYPVYYEGPYGYKGAVGCVFGGGGYGY
jgi:hypothetical protein